MSKTLGSVMNGALTAIGEAEVTAIDTDNMLHDILIRECNNGVREVLTKCRFRWGLHRTSLVTTEPIETENVSVTNGSDTVTSVDSDGADAQNFGSVTTDMFIRVGTDLTSYAITAVDSTSDPHTLTIEQNYLGTTDTDATYIVIHDTYDFSNTTMDEIVSAQYGEGRVHTIGLRGQMGDSNIEQVDLQTIIRAAGGDLHRDSSGKPALFCELQPDASGNRRLLFWPYPDDEYLIELWGVPKYSDATAFATVLFGTDAPDIAYDVVEYRMCRRACQYDNDSRGVAYWNHLYKGDGAREFGALGDLMARENREYQADNILKVDTFRRGRLYGLEVRSQTAFDRSYIKNR